MADPVLGEVLMALATERRFHAHLVSAGMPKDIVDHEAPRIGKAMKKSILALYRSAKNRKEWDEDFSPIADRGLVMWGVDDPFVPIAYARRFCDRWSIPLAAVEGVAHWGLCEAPGTFAEHLQAHWSK